MTQTAIILCEDALKIIRKIGGTAGLHSISDFIHS